MENGAFTTIDIMKTVLFVRHGKSSWEYEANDKDRPLKERGINDAHAVASEVRKMGVSVDFVYSSPANRALHTAVIFARNLQIGFDTFRIIEALYDFSGEGVLGFLKGLGDHQDTVMVFGHNYAFTSLVNTLGDTYIENVPTAGLTIIQFPVDQWKSIGNGHTVKTIFPRDLR